MARIPHWVMLSGRTDSTGATDNLKSKYDSDFTANNKTYVRMVLQQYGAPSGQSPTEQQDVFLDILANLRA